MRETEGPTHGGSRRTVRELSLRVFGCVKRSAPKALRTSGWLLMLMIPISFLVMLLEYFGILAVVADFLAPAFRFIGLSGEAPLVFITAVTLNIYSAIAVIETLSLGMREVTILALMCLIAHNLPVETAVQRRTGSPAASILVTRLAAAILAAFVLSMVLPQSPTAEPTHPSSIDTTEAVDGTEVESEAFTEGDDRSDGEKGRGKRRTIASLDEFAADAPALLSSWAVESIRTAAKIIGIVAGLLLLQQLLTEFSLNRRLTAIFRPLLRGFGLPDSTHFLWIVANTLGLAYGSAVMISEVDAGRLEARDADLLNRHIAISHSLLEDTLLFVAIGVGVFWITAPRLLLAIASVWLVRGVRRMGRHTHRSDV